jgi:lysophospholipase L1-like esterase
MKRPILQMKKTQRKPLFGILLCIAFIALSCNKEDEQEAKPISTSINKILPLGASRVAGNRPDYESFRYELWKDLEENGWTFDFIGTQSDEGDYPSFNSLDFDIDHEGIGGWTSAQILQALPNNLQETGAPDFVLFSSPGGNDALLGLPFNEAIDNINSIIDVLQNANPNITIIIELMAPGHSNMMTPELTTYFEQLQQGVVTICEEQTSSNSSVVAVDMYTGFSDAYLADDVHYNVTGADFIAQRYYNLLATLLE